jgi:hypothetical protein
MKKFIVTCMMAAVVAIMLPLAADAQTYTTRRVYRNGRYQTVRVVTRTNQGYRYGTRRVTSQEQRRLALQRARLQRLENRVTRDGVITRQENRRLNKRVNKYNRRVNRARNN